MITASLCGSFCAMDAQPRKSRDRAGLHMSLRPARMARDPDWRKGEALVVPLDPVPVVVAGARKADHLPARQVLVSAVDRVGEETVLRVLEDELEELGPVGAFELEGAVLEAGDHLILFGIGKPRERPVRELVLARAVERGERLAVVLRRRDRRLLALLLGALLERPAHVTPLVAAVRAGKLPIDVHGAARILAAGRLRIGRDQPVDHGLDRRRLVGGGLEPGTRAFR